MIGIGTLVNGAAIVAGGLCGLLGGSRMNERCREGLSLACGISVLFIGIAGAMEKMLTVSNGVINAGASADRYDLRVIDAGGTPVSVLPGGALISSELSFAIMRGGHIDVTVLGALEVDREGIRRITATQAYLGRWLLLVTIGFLQAVIATIGDLVLGIQCEHPLLFILAGIFCSFVYINIIYALAVAFRHIGKAIAVILVIVQIPGASGLYPIEMMPNFFRELHPWLPFTYGINAMRGPIAGLYANHYWLDMLHLFWYLPAALFVGLVVRRYAMNLNALFDRYLQRYVVHRIRKESHALAFCYPPEQTAAVLIHALWGFFREGRRAGQSIGQIRPQARALLRGLLSAGVLMGRGER